jgi:nucleoside-diphosphate-sugar epimerase
MRVFVAGGTGAIGRFLVPQLLQAGHQVVLLARSPDKAKALEVRGTKVVVADALRRDELTAAIQRVEPEVIIHQLTSIMSATDLKNFDEQFARTNRLRTEATDTLLAAARSVGTRRFIAQSFCGWTFARVGGPVKTEDDPLDPNPPKGFRETQAAIRYLEEAVTTAAGLQGIALRYGWFYGPGSSFAKEGPILDRVRKRRFPIVGDGAGVWSFIHLHDAARATVAAIYRGGPGLYNVVDDEPATVSKWLPELAAAVGAKPPFRVPVWLGRLIIGEGGVSIMTQIRGASNAKAKRELDWQPEFASWRRGFAEGLG